MDILSLIPIPPTEVYFMSPTLRTLLGPSIIDLMSSGNKLELDVGRSLGILSSHYPDKGVKQRSLTAIVLATSFEKQGLSWASIDPGISSLGNWRKMLKPYRKDKPRVVSISTTFFTTTEWLNVFIAMCRRYFPDAVILVGGYMYGTSTESFLSLNADLFMIGEAEERFPQIIEAIKYQRSYTHIQGVYYRTPNGGLEFTGHPPPLKLRELDPPDWSLSKKIEPKADPKEAAFSIAIETQRGCVFKCQFCTFRTLTSPNVLSVEQAVQRIRDTDDFTEGTLLAFTDATATFPEERWVAIIDELNKQGGSKHPIFAYARVNDLTDEIVQKMDQANVRSVFIGQESGSQEILKAMKKGTHIRRVKPAVDALANSRVGAVFGFIHGLPGENKGTMQETRDMICSLNSEHTQAPVVYQFALSPFTPQDLAAAAHDDKLKENRIATQNAVEAVIETFIAASKVPHAPNMFGIGPSSPETPYKKTKKMSRTEYFRWAKNMQKGIGMFIAAQQDNSAVDRQALNEIKKDLLDGLKPVPWYRKNPFEQLQRRFIGLIYNIIAKEFIAEGQTGKAGLLTKTITRIICFSGGGGLMDFMSKPNPSSSKDIDRLGAELAKFTVTGPKNRVQLRKEAREDERKKLVASEPIPVKMIVP